MLWSFQELGTGQGSVAVSKEKVFVTGIPDTLTSEGFLFAFDTKGKLLWKKSYGKDWTGIFPGARSTPTVVDNLVYIESGNGSVHCLKADNGEELWNVDFFKDFQADSVQFGFSESILIDGDKLYCTPGGKENNMIALNRFTGKMIWSSPAFREKATYCSPILINHNGHRLLVNLTSTSIIGLNADNGEMQWRVHQFQDNKIHANTPVYFDGKLLISSASRKDSSGLVMLQLSPDGKQAEIVWRNKEFINLMGGFILKDGFVYGGAYLQPKWFCIDTQTGLTKYIAKELGGGPVIYADGLFYCYAEKDGEMALASGNSEQFNIITKFKIPLGTAQHWAHPVIADGNLYIRHNEALMVYDIKN
ncbi:polyvinylalcohol dehydrogenase [Aquipluma nitroreducens]|uniref:Polyvinylalcohol dehydrogenase n=2 Tax=Aquipluma nitroreducens TaxID=2010828 RepID=A0A5K7SAM7_9BACT|nr:polyvinylalcohol dehydrogenase [Aquipluma nitroreducens]